LVACGEGQVCAGSAARVARPTRGKGGGGCAKHTRVSRHGHVRIHDASHVNSTRAEPRRCGRDAPPRVHPPLLARGDSAETCRVLLGNPRPLPFAPHTRAAMCQRGPSDVPSHTQRGGGGKGLLHALRSASRPSLAQPSAWVCWGGLRTARSGARVLVAAAAPQDGRRGEQCPGRGAGGLGRCGKQAQGRVRRVAGGADPEGAVHLPFTTPPPTTTTTLHDVPHPGRSAPDAVPPPPPLYSILPPALAFLRSAGVRAMARSPLSRALPLTGGGSERGCVGHGLPRGVGAAHRAPACIHPPPRTNFSVWLHETPCLACVWCGSFAPRPLGASVTTLSFPACAFPRLVRRGTASRARPGDHPSGRGWRDGVSGACGVRVR
jgi:hypothetical protein